MFYHDKVPVRTPGEAAVNAVLLSILTTVEWLEVMMTQKSLSVFNPSVQRSVGSRTVNSQKGAMYTVIFRFLKRNKSLVECRIFQIGTTESTENFALKFLN